MLSLFKPRNRWAGMYQVFQYRGSQAGWLYVSRPTSSLARAQNQLKLWNAVHGHKYTHRIQPAAGPLFRVEPMWTNL